MQIGKIVSSSGTHTLINLGRKHAEKLANHSNPDIQSRAEPVKNAVDDLQSAYSARRPLRALWVTTTRKKKDADDALDTCISSISYDLLSPALLNRNRHAEEYRVLFPKGNIAFINAPEREELADVAGMVLYLEKNPNHPMASRAAELKEKSLALEATLDPQAAAEAAHRSAETTEREARKALGRTLKKSALFLRDQFEGDETAVDKLFPTLAEAKVEEDKDEGDEDLIYD